jgi:hypothetical protein
VLSIGIVVGLVGYGLVFWGAQMWSGCTQNSFLDIMWPGGQRFTPCAPQGGGGSSGSAAAVQPGTGAKLPPGMAPQLGGHS